MSRERPNDAHERDFADALGVAPAHIAGVDEVGRGPLAGPVCAGAAMLDLLQLDPGLAAQLDDSKRIPAGRDAIADALTAAPGAMVAVGWADVEEIAALNILKASHLAMRRAIDALAKPPAGLLVDGNVDPRCGAPTRLVKGGDRKSLAIAAASILAKTARDAEMRRLDAAFPGYGWAQNAGYPTAAHRAALTALGATPHHRRGFKGVDDRAAD